MRWAWTVAFLGAVAGCSIETEGLKAAGPDALPAAVDAAVDPGDGGPPEPELCDGIDNDGDSTTADGADDPQVGMRCDGSDDDACPEGTSACVGARVVCEDFTDNTHEVCNDEDDDCDGTIDESAMDATTWYPDADGDGWGADTAAIVACDAPAGHVVSTNDCDDANGAVSPEAAEACNLVDDDCDGTIDDAPSSCGCLGHIFEGRIYLFCQSEVIWEDARDDCVARGGQLASVLSEPEHDLLLDRVAFYDDRPWWIGFTDDGTEMSWRWIDGSPTGFTAWNEGEPNDGGGSWWLDEDCATMNHFDTGTWNDAECTELNPYVCELP